MKLICVEFDILSTLHLRRVCPSQNFRSGLASLWPGAGTTDLAWHTSNVCSCEAYQVAASTIHAQWCPLNTNDLSGYTCGIFSFAFNDLRVVAAFCGMELHRLWVVERFASSSAEGREAKLRRLHFLRKRVAHVTASALPQLLQEVQKSGTLELAKRKHVHEETEKALGETSWTSCIWTTS